MRFLALMAFLLASGCRPRVEASVPEDAAVMDGAMGQPDAGAQAAGSPLPAPPDPERSVTGVTPDEGCFEDEAFGTDGCAAGTTCVIVAIEDPPGDPGDSECVPVSCLGGEGEARKASNRPWFETFENLLRCPEYAALHPEPEEE
jgi:hypothetical protein